MSRYEREFGTDWDTLDKDEATDRAYAIGVAERLGEYDREELEASRRDELGVSHEQVELAYDEGRNERRKRRRRPTPTGTPSGQTSSTAR